MAHKSKKKHLEHVHEHEPATPKAKSPVVKAEAASARVARPVMKTRKAMKAAGKPRTAAAGEAATPSGRKPEKKRGLVRSLAVKATKKITAKPRKIISRVKARVKSVIGAGD